LLLLRQRDGCTEHQHPNVTSSNIKTVSHLASFLHCTEKEKILGLTPAATSTAHKFKHKNKMEGGSTLMRIKTEKSFLWKT
jgi:hypothetical protein